MRCCLFLLGIFFTSFSLVFSNSGGFLSLPSSVEAGEKIAINFSGFFSRQSLNVQLVRPESATLDFTAQTDDMGRALLSIDGSHLSRSGDYILRTVHGGASLDPVQKNFSITPGKISATRSKVVIHQHSALADGREKIRGKIFARDAYENPIPHQMATIISSRTGDIFETSKTDADGVADFSALSSVPGVSTWSFMIGETLLPPREEIVFLFPKNTPRNVGSSGLGNFLKTQLFEENEEIAFFTIEDLPDRVSVGETYGFRVVAKNSNNETIRNFSQTVSFSSTDGRARLPQDYTFVLEDQGEHRFDLSLVFNSVGNYNLTVFLAEDPSIEATRPVAVYDPSDTNAGSIDTSGKNIVLQYPTDGSGINTSRVSISGKATGLEKVSVVDHGTITITDNAPVGADGTFYYQTPALEDGLHEISVTSNDGIVKSETVSITVDTVPPQGLGIKLEPSAVSPSASFQAIITASEVLTETKCTLEQVDYELQPLLQPANAYATNLEAPKSCGKFPITCIVSDTFGNRSEALTQELQVCDAPEDQTKYPVSGKNMRSIPESDRITWEWKEANLDTTGLKNFVILHGTSADNLLGRDEIPDLRDRWYVKNLESEKKYFFQLLGVTKDTSEEVPISPVVFETTLRGKSKPDRVQGVAGQPGYDQVILHWSPAKDDGDIAYYTIRFGENMDAMNFLNQTPDNRTLWEIRGLKPEQLYYFTISATDTDGEKGEESGAISLRPGEEFLPAAYKGTVPASGFPWGVSFFATMTVCMFFYFLRWRNQENG